MTGGALGSSRDRSGIALVRQLQHAVNQLVDARCSLTDAFGNHVGGRADQFSCFVFDDVIDSAWRVAAAHFGNGRSGIRVVADGAGNAGTVDLRCKCRGDADQPDRFACFCERLCEFQQPGFHLAGRALQGKVGKVLRRAETARDDQGIKVFCICFADVLHLTSCNARRLDQHIARLGHFLASQVIDDVMLGDVRRKALDLRTTLIQTKQGEDAFMDFGTVIDAAAGQDYSHFFLHRFGSLYLSNLRLLLIRPLIDRFTGRVFSSRFTGYAKMRGEGRGLRCQVAAARCRRVRPVSLHSGKETEKLLV
ncbi:Unknown protein sequence [Pseudomonas savastanoi pv. fraxini]|nr:Unknown protein sequence [Pseudomonas savastanoi pv. fraxini]